MCAVCVQCMRGVQAGSPRLRRRTSNCSSTMHAPCAPYAHHAHTMYQAYLQYLPQLQLDGDLFVFEPEP